MIDLVIISDNKVSRYGAVISMFCILSVCMSCGSKENKQDSTSLDEVTIEKKQLDNQVESEVLIKDGMFKVGEDIDEGEYIIFSLKDKSAYYQVSIDSTGSVESIVSNDYFIGTRYQELKLGQYIRIKNAIIKSEKECGALNPNQGKYSQGMYKIGRDIQPGEYKVTAISERGYISVNKDSKNIIDSIITNDSFEGTRYITVSSGNYLIMKNCDISVEK